jgi:transcriptional regulator with XRE-family HTH domain
MPRIIEFLGFDPEPQPDTLGQRLAYARRRLGLTQEGLAEKLEVDAGTILRWKKGDCVPPAKKLALLRELLPANCGIMLR